MMLYVSCCGVVFFPCSGFRARLYVPRAGAAARCFWSAVLVAPGWGDGRQGSSKVENRGKREDKSGGFEMGTDAGKRRGREGKEREGKAS